MKNAGRRLIKNAPAVSPDLKREIGVFVVSGLVPFVEAADTVEELLFDQDRRCAAIVRVAKEVEDRVPRVSPVAPVRRGSVLPNDPARFLKREVRVNQLRSDKSRFGKGFESLHQRIQPPRKNDGVVVQEVEVLPSRVGCPAIAARDETFVGSIRQEPNPWAARKYVRGRIG